MELKEYGGFYFLGAGGIGMSGLIRWLMSEGKAVAGYDRTPSPLTDELIGEGALLHFEDDVHRIPPDFLDPARTLVIRTPAVPDHHSELNFFRYKGFSVLKRAELLGMIANQGAPVAVAGTHGKTSVSTFISHLLVSSGIGCQAFLGGISKNYRTNFIRIGNSPIVVAEADEFDRSFLHIHPRLAVITSTDADHLDIYGSRQNLLDAFSDFVSQIRPEGVLVLKAGLDLEPQLPPGLKVLRYQVSGDSDFCARNLQTGQGFSSFDLQVPGPRLIPGFRLSLPGRINVENAVAALAAAYLLGVPDDKLISATAGFQGVRRRFDYIIREPELCFIDDYAHHPSELTATIQTIRDSHPGRKITGIFQPHLYSRTRDFAAGFAESLDLLDEIVLLEIYPAREEPIPGVSSEIIFSQMKNPNRVLCSKSQILAEMAGRRVEVLVTLGAGDIDRWVDPLADLLRSEYRLKSK